MKSPNKPLWPHPKNRLTDEPHFCFLVTPPNSGSTAIAKLLNTSHRTTLLNDNGEAQWLVPGLCRPKERWDPDMEVDYASVKAVWLKQFQYLRDCVGSVDTVIEKSPPNLVRLDALADLFQNVSIIANNRDPYANIASIGYRYSRFDDRPTSEREDFAEKIAHQWVFRSRKISDILQKHACPLVTYEMFCEDPQTLIQSLNLPKGVADTIDIGANVAVKDYAEQGISNQNARQIEQLSAAEIDRISKVLETEPELLKTFGYKLF